MEGELGSDAGGVAGEELDVFGVGAVGEGVGASAGAGEFAGFDVHGDPLEARASEDLERAAWAKGQGLDLAVALASGDTPGAGEGGWGFGDALPGFGGCIAEAEGEGVAGQDRVEGEGLAYAGRFGGVEVDGGGQLIGGLGEGAAEGAVELGLGSVVGGVGPVAIDDEEDAFGGGVGGVPGAGPRGGGVRGGEGDEEGEGDEGEGGFHGVGFGSGTVIIR